MLAGSVSSNAYSSSSEAVRVTRPCPSKRCSTPALSVLLGTSPFPNAPLWQQSSSTTIERARLWSIASLTKRSSIAVVRTHSSSVLAVAK